MERRQAEAFMRGKTWLSETPADFQERMLAKCDLLQFKAAGSVYEVGDDPGGMFGVVEGHIELHLPTHGSETTLAYIGGPGFWAGDIAAVTGRSRLISIVAGAGSQLLRLPRAELLRMAASDPNVWRNIVLLLARNLAKSMRVIAALKRSEPESRIAAMLLILTEDQQGRPAIVSASQTHLAALTQLSRSAVNAALKGLEDQGLIRRRYGSIEVPAPAALDDFVWADPPERQARPARRAVR